MTKAKKAPEVKHGILTQSCGWVACGACYRSWKVGAKRIPVCAPRVPQKVYHG